MQQIQILFALLHTTIVEGKLKECGLILHGEKSSH